MNRKLFWLSLIGVLASFAGGFLLANSLNRKEIVNLQTENENLKKNQAEPVDESEDFTLGDEEIKQKIAEADRNPQNIAFQKNLGLALYNYASMKKNAELLAEVSRLITRVYENDPNDYEAIETLGNINFDIGYFKENNENLQKAREFYLKALDKKPDDVEIRTDLGLTYLLSSPPDANRAVENFEKSLKLNPKHEKTLQVMIRALLNQGKREEAEKFISGLKEVNPNNRILSELDSSSANNESNLQKQ